MRAEVAYRRASSLGEGSLWDVAHQRLYWVDIAQHKVFIFDPKSGENREYDVGQDVGTVVLTQNDKLLLALRSGFAVLDPSSETVTPLCDPRTGVEEGRFNDGKCDPQGRFWAGTIAEGPESKGKAKLYRFDPDSSTTEMLAGVTISNGLCWSGDSRTFYYVDTPTHEVAAFDFDSEAGSISGRRVAFELDEGAPDGMTIDAEGQLWIALFDGGCVLRVDPNTGERTFRVDVPEGGSITSCAFGGADLKQLYITTARIALSDERPAELPGAGSLFVAQVPFRGVPTPRFAGEL